MNGEEFEAASPEKKLQETLAGPEVAPEASEARSESAPEVPEAGPNPPDPGPPGPKSPRSPWLRALAVPLIAAVLGGLIGAAAVIVATRGKGGPVQLNLGPVSVAGSAVNLANLASTSRASAESYLPRDLLDSEKNTVAVVAVSTLGVVQIQVRHNEEDANSKLPENHPFKFNPGIPLRTSGSGFVYDKEGHVVTNNHVVEGADEVRVVFIDGRAYKGRVLGRDPLSDLAVLKVEAPPEQLVPLPIGDSNAVRVGQKAIAIGSPLGGSEGEGMGLDRAPTVTEGIVSARDRLLPINNPKTGERDFQIDNLIQTDAAINPGNSGGPLLNSRGEVIGVNTAIVPSAQGIGFAIPSDAVKGVIPQLIARQKVGRPLLGITYRGIDSIRKSLEEYGLEGEFKKFRFPVDKGALVIDVKDGSGAAQAGLKGSDGKLTIGGDPWPAGGDIIVAVDGVEISGEDLTTRIQKYKPGDTVKLTIYRDSQRLEVSVTLKSRDE
ncbi:MAG: trypsin-like peptidase domain-containing protein [Actinobacteria bacterium]|nr:trypsin-like peptidase domain-containing protein [Actinomycetota bacterium]